MKIQKTVGAAVMALALVVAGSGAAGAVTGSISGNGNDSFNKIKATSYKQLKVENENNLRVRNDNEQKAYTGDAKVIDNYQGGNATSGAASNANSTSVSATVNNAASAGAWAGVVNGGGSHNVTISENGNDSFNKVEIKDVTKVRVENENNVRVSNNNEQRASSGDAKVIDNYSGGNATSGAASNTNSTSVTLNLSN